MDNEKRDTHEKKKHLNRVCASACVCAHLRIVLIARWHDHTRSSQLATLSPVCGNTILVPNHLGCAVLCCIHL